MQPLAFTTVVGKKKWKKKSYMLNIENKKMKIIK